MTEFEKKYVVFCLRSMAEILSNATELQKAVNDFTKGKTTANYVKNDLVNWDPQTKLRLNSAYFEANARTQTKFLTDESIVEAHNAQEFFVTQFLPKVVKNVEPNNPLKSVISNIKAQLAELSPPHVTSEISQFATDYPMTFFAAVATASVISAAIGIKLTK